MEENSQLEFIKVLLLPIQENTNAGEGIFSGLLAGYEISEIALFFWILMGILFCWNLWQYFKKSACRKYKTKFKLP